MAAGSALTVTAVMLFGGKPVAVAQQDTMLLRAPANTGVGLALRDRGPTVAVTAVVEGSPSDVVGIRARDIIEAVDGVNVKSAKHLLAVFAAAPRGKAVKLSIRRGSSRLEVNVVPQPVRPGVISQ
jgi:S1-C subfamily serine protease